MTSVLSGASTATRSKSLKSVLTTATLAGHNIDSWAPLIQAVLGEVPIRYICPCANLIIFCWLFRLPGILKKLRQLSRHDRQKIWLAVEQSIRAIGIGYLGGIKFHNPSSPSPFQTILLSRMGWKRSLHPWPYLPSLFLPRSGQECQRRCLAHWFHQN